MKGRVQPSERKSFAHLPHISRFLLDSWLFKRQPFVIIKVKQCLSLQPCDWQIYSHQLFSNCVQNTRSHFLVHEMLFCQMADIRTPKKRGKTSEMQHPQCIIISWGLPETFNLILDVAQSLSPVGFFVTPRTVARQHPLSVGFSRQDCWSGLPCLFPV